MLIAVTQLAQPARRCSFTTYGRAPSTPTLERRRVGAEARGSGAGSWEHDAVHAFTCIDFAPATQERVAVNANARAAELLGMRHEELLARYAQHAVPLALPPLDVLCGFLHSLLTAYDEIATRYARILVPGGAALVRVSSVKAFDPLRRLRQVPPAPCRADAFV